VSVPGSGALLNDSDIEYNSGNTADVGSDTGYTVGGAIGYRLKESGVRFEAQFNHQKNDIDSASALVVTITAGGDATINSGMANVIVDFKTKSPKWTP
jgi:hypothetical protein